MRYKIEYDMTTRWVVEVDADGPDEAIETFWKKYWNGDEGRVTDYIDGPNGLSMTDTFGNPVVWGQRTDLS